MKLNKNLVKVALPVGLLLLGLHPLCEEIFGEFYYFKAALTTRTTALVVQTYKITYVFLTTEKPEWMVRLTKYCGLCPSPTVLSFNHETSLSLTLTLTLNQVVFVA